MAAFPFPWGRQQVPHVGWKQHTALCIWTMVSFRDGRLWAWHSTLQTLSVIRPKHYLTAFSNLTLGRVEQLLITAQLSPKADFTNTTRASKEHVGMKRKISPKSSKWLYILSQISLLTKQWARTKGVSEEPNHTCITTYIICIHICIHVGIIFALFTCRRVYIHICITYIGTFLIWNNHNSVKTKQCYVIASNSEK